MDRSLRLEISSSGGHRAWIRATAVAAAVTALGLGARHRRPAAGPGPGPPALDVGPARARCTPAVRRPEGRHALAHRPVFLRDPWYWPELSGTSIPRSRTRTSSTGRRAEPRLGGRPPARDGGQQRRHTPLAQVRAEPLKDAVRAIPYDLLMDFVRRPTCSTARRSATKPYVVGNARPAPDRLDRERGVRVGPRRTGGWPALHHGQRGRRAARPGRRRRARLHRPLRRTARSSRPPAPWCGGRLDPQDAREDELTHLRVLETGREILPATSCSRPRRHRLRTS